MACCPFAVGPRAAWHRPAAAQRLGRLRRLRAVGGLWGGGLAGRAAWRAGRVVLLIAVAGVAAVAGCGVQHPHAGVRPSASLQGSGGWKPVGYAGIEVDIPASWPVVNLGTDRTACFSYNGPALYLGWDADVPSCPASPARSPAGIVELAQLSATSYAAARPMGAPVTVHGQAGYPVKGPKILAFPGLDLLVLLEASDQATDRHILDSLRQAGPIPTPSPAPALTPVSAMGLARAGAGWALTGQGLFATGTDGRRWANITPPGVRPGRVSGVFFLDARHGWAAVGVRPGPQHPPSEVIYRTADGGARWQATQLPLPTQRYYDTGFVDWASADLAFTGPLHGWIELPRATNTSHSEAVLYRTADGGRSWAQARAPVAGPITFTTATHGWTSGGAGPNQRLYATGDGGQSWQQQTWAGEPASPHTGPAIFGPQHQILAIETPNVAQTGGTLTFYTPTGTDPAWRPAVGLPSRLTADAVAVVRSSDWVVIADPYLFTTTDAGRHWTRVLTTPRIDGASLVMADAQHGWILQPATCDSFNCGDQLLTTTDGGRTWTPLNPGAR